MILSIVVPRQIQTTADREEQVGGSGVLLTKVKVE